MTSKAEYLKKYLSKDDGNEVKKKKRKKLVHQKSTVSAKPKHFQIVDEDAPVPVPSLTTDKVPEEAEDSDEPVVEILDKAQIDELKMLGKFKTENWKTASLDAEKRSKKPKKRHDSSGSASDSEPTRSVKPQRKRHDSSESDNSPIRKRQNSSHSDQSPPRRRHDSSGSDISVPRKATIKSQNHSPARKRHDSSGSDIDVPRKPAKIRNESSGSDLSLPRKPARKASDSDISPPRSRVKREPNSPGSRDVPKPSQRPFRVGMPVKRERKSSGSSSTNDSDISPPRRMPTEIDIEDRPIKREPETPPREGPKKPQKTLSGQNAGLRTAKELRDEAEKLRKRDDEVFSKLDEKLSGRGAETVFREGATERKRNQRKKQELTEEQIKRQQELEAKYKQWNKGLKQVRDRSSKLEEMASIAAKPLARYEGDEDLESHLKEQEYREDPMLQYMQEKQKKKLRKAGVAEYPKYKGPPPPPNRFGIQPGYRWDGVDRSNGFETKLSNTKNLRRADDEEFYKWQSGNYE